MLTLAYRGEGGGVEADAYVILFIKEICGNGSQYSRIGPTVSTVWTLICLVPMLGL